MEKLIPKLRFPEFKGEWEKKTLVDVSDKITDGTHDTPKPVDKGIPFLTAIHIKDGFIDYENCYYLDEDVHNSIYKRCNPEKGDLLIVNIGAGTATCAINTVDYEFSLKNVALIKPNKNKLIGSFLLQIQRHKSPKIFNQLTSGGAQPFLSLKEIGKLIVPLPTLPEQQKIATFLTSVDEKLQALKKKKSLLEQYKKGVMQKIFSQELRFKDENGNDFPEWEEKSFGEVAEIKKGEQLNKEELTESGSYPCLNGGINFSGYTEKFNSKENTITISEGGNSCGYINFMTTKFWLGGHCYKIINFNNLNNSYLYQLLKFNEQKIMNLRVGSGLPNIQLKDLKCFQLKISESIVEQTHIANFLTSIDDKINHCGEQIANMEVWKKGLLQGMFC